MTEQNLTQLRELLVREFTEEELNALCNDIGLKYADLPGMGPYGKTREMITAAQEKHVIPDLMARVNDLRPEAYKAAHMPGLDTETTTPAPGEPSSQAEPASARVAEASAGAPRDIGKPSAVSQPRISGLSLRARLIGFIIVVLLLAVAVLTLVYKPTAAPVAPLPTETAMPQVSTALTTTGETQGAVVTDTTALQPASELTPTAAIIGDSHPAAQAVLGLNDQLMNFYTGKEQETALQQYWSATAYKIVTNFAYKTLKTRLGVDIAAGDVPAVSMHYVKSPALQSESGNTAKVTTREYWSYTNSKTSKSICDTSDYTYTLVKTGDKYVVDDLKSRSVSSTCEN